ncbi:autotransporter outer membrane beta-barrel domain-containing protein [Oxalobacter paraformigenes]|uniref:Outer membrane autotransporter barrel domain-containing protein n=1 Tax=Oxalobacter paraformigenes TaxID=556268 RepID=C3X2P4_9BURK|nr:autotransporter outer membrane beta-barrel domain-containing protein [Oxalobacter paraformigenes]EEO27480.1 outer membrane autotransporter barrel domain-containing protein [Oxalobacter paraformigenes]
MVSVDKDGSLESRINASFMNEQSYFKGLTNDPYGVGTGKIDLTFANQAYWIVPEDNALRGTLTLRNGRVYVGGTPDMFSSTTHNKSAVLDNARTLTLDNLAGSGGIFYLRADIASDNADRIVVKNGEGNHSLMVRSTGAEPSAARMNTYLASLKNGSANFTLANRDGKVDAGTFQYILKNENTGSGKGWYLAQDDGSDTPPPIVPDAPYTPPPSTVPEARPRLTPAAETALSLSNSHIRMRSVQANNMPVRLRDLRQHALSNRSAQGSETSGSATAASPRSGIASLALNGWADSFGQTGRFKSFEGSRYDQDVYGLALGADKQFREKNAVWFLGARGQYTKADQKLNDHVGRGDGNSKGLALYGIWIHESGWYANAILSADHYRQHLEAYQTDGTSARGHYGVWGYGANLEVGKHIPLANRFFLEPQVILDYYRVNGVSYTLDNDLDIDADAVNYLSGKAGLRVGQNWKTGERQYLEYFLKGGISHEFDSKQRMVTNNTYVFSDDFKGNRLFYGMEVSGSLNKYVRLYGQIEREKGDDFDTDWTFNAGLRLSF